MSLGCFENIRLRVFRRGERGYSGSVAGTSDHEGYVAQICGYRWSYDLRSLGVTLEQPHNRGIALEELISEWPGLIKNEWQTFAPSMNSSRESFPSIFLSICLKILSVLFSGVDSSSGIFITDPTWRHKYSKGCNFLFKRFQNSQTRANCSLLMHLTVNVQWNRLSTNCGTSLQAHLVQNYFLLKRIMLLRSFWHSQQMP